MVSILFNFPISGPGNLVRELLNRGADKVIAVEKKVQFMSDLQKIAESSNGRLTTVHANYFMPSHTGNSAAPKADTNEIFKDVEPQCWESTEPSKFDLKKRELNVIAMGNLPDAFCKHFT